MGPVAGRKVLAQRQLVINEFAQTGSRAVRGQCTCSNASIEAQRSGDRIVVAQATGCGTASMARRTTCRPVARQSSRQLSTQTSANRNGATDAYQDRH